MSGFFPLFADVLLILTISIGLGSWLGSPLKGDSVCAGIRAFVGFCMLEILLFVFIVPGQSGFDFAFMAIVLLSAIGIACLGFSRWKRSSKFPNETWVDILCHPIMLLPTMIGLVGLASRPVEFLPYGDDIYVNWLTHAKQIWLANDYWYEGMASPGLGYLPGWHFLLAFTSSLWGEFSDTRTLAVPTVFHIALLGMVFDIITTHFRFRFSDTRYVSLWLGLFSLFFMLAAEASWKLLPTLVLSEMPLFYTSIGLLALTHLYWRPDVNSLKVTVILAVVLAAHYLIKTQGLALIPVASGIAFAGMLVSRKGHPHRFIWGGASALAVVVPVAAIMLTWSALGPQSTKCISSAGGMLSGGFMSFIQSDTWLRLGLDLLAETGSYLGSYKLPVTLLSVMGLIGALCYRRLRWMSLAVFAYFCVYLIAVFFAYLGCPNGFNEYLSSLKRYLQLPIRSLHFIGLICLFYWFGEKLSNFRPRQIIHPLNMMGLASLVVFMGYQFVAIKRSFQHISDPEVEAKMVNYVRTISAETKAISMIAADQGILKPRVLMTYVFWESFPFLVARHHAYPVARTENWSSLSSASKDESDPLARWHLTHVGYKSENAINGITKLPLNSYDIIWVLDRNAEVANGLRSLVSNPVCADDPSRFYLIRTNSNENPFTCFPRVTNAK